MGAEGLRTRCQVLQLPTSGAKSALIERLLEHQEKLVKERHEQKHAKDQLFIKKLDEVFELGEVAARYMISDLALLCAKRISQALADQPSRLKEGSAQCLIRLLRL